MLAQCLWDNADKAGTATTAASFLSLWTVDNTARSLVASTLCGRPPRRSAFSLGPSAALLDRGNADIALWLLRLLSEAATAESAGRSGAWLAQHGQEQGGAPGLLMQHVFRPQLVTGLIGYVTSLQQHQRNTGLRVLAMALRHTPLSALSPSARTNLSELRAQMQMMHSRDSSDGSPYFQALVEVMVAVSLSHEAQRTAEGRGSDTKDDDAGPDADVVCTQRWFRDVCEVAGIMEAFIDRRKPLPLDFLVSDDTFQVHKRYNAVAVWLCGCVLTLHTLHCRLAQQQKLVLVDETRVIESQHPYSLDKPVKGTIHVEHARSLQVRFDARCATESKHHVALYEHEGADSALVTHTGSFGAKVFKVTGNTFAYEFPVSNVMAWTLANSRHSKEFVIGSDKRTVVYQGKDKWRSMISRVGFSEGVHSWEVKVNNTTKSGNIFIGIGLFNAPESSYLGKTSAGWGWIGCQALWHGGKKVIAARTHTVTSNTSNTMHQHIINMLLPPDTRPTRALGAVCAKGIPSR